MDFSRQILFLTVAFLGVGLGKGMKGRMSGDVYEVGVGIADVTGPTVGIPLMGYANPAQIANGIHTRLFARTLIVKSNGSPAVFVSVDAGMIDTAIKREVLSQLDSDFGGIYNQNNVLLSGTHTHSGPAGYIQYVMYGVASLGFHRSNFEAIVAGIVLSIRRAHHTLQPGRLSIAKGELLEASINRSPTAYNKNPESERAQYEHNVDKEMTLLRVDAEDGSPLGAFNWFAVHPVSMNNTNKLVSGDNKGYASMLFEYQQNPNDRPGKGSFVAAFASTNLGDVSPNTRGPKCIKGPYAGQDCDIETSACGDLVQYCIALGPGRNGDMEESTEIIGKRQFDKAYELFSSPSEDFIPVVGKVQYISQNVNMSSFKFEMMGSDGTLEEVTTCAAAMGYSFGAGTVDGPGMFNFTQGDTSGDEFWDRVRDFIKEPTPEQIACHEPKPILLSVGDIHIPYDWAPSVVETQILRIGNLYLVGMPGEPTTMAGRRMRKAVKDRILALSNPEDPEPHVIIAALSNVYTHYITTFEEYQVQRYEGASMIYGPHTFDAYMFQYPRLVENMLKEGPVEKGPEPPNFMDLQISLLLPIVIDLPPPGCFIGQTKVEPLPYYFVGETVRTTFISGHMRNNPLREGSFFIVEHLESESKWRVVATDADWNTKIKWSRPSGIFSLDSQVEISWRHTTTPATPPGTYRIRHFGFSKPYKLEPVQYEGTTRTFEVRDSGTIEGVLKLKEKRIETSAVKLWKKLTTSHLVSN